MTGCGSEHVAVEAMKSGAADYLVKPFQLDALKLVIDSTLRLRRRGDQPAATTTPAAVQNHHCEKIDGRSASGVSSHAWLYR
jgi:DNA-binding NtrC family response regulator